jgi:translation initiation factor 3 subunit J
LKDEDPLAKRERLEKIQLKNDLDATQDLFGVVEATKSFTVRESVKQVRSLEEILAQKPESKQDYESLAKSLAEKLTEYSTITSSKIPKKSPHWIGFLEVLFRELCDQSNIDYVDIRKLSSVLSTLSNEKQRAEKDKKGKGKSTKKAQLKVESSSAFESAAVEGGLDDGYDDFM